MHSWDEYEQWDPEVAAEGDGSRQAVKEKMLDKTISDSFPASDPPSSLPDPEADSFAVALTEKELRRSA